VIVPETNEHQTGCAMKRMFAGLDSWHLESNAHFELDLRLHIGIGRRFHAWLYSVVCEKQEVRLPPE
jgi:hypothetical protein